MYYVSIKLKEQDGIHRTVVSNEFATAVEVRSCIVKAVEALGVKPENVKGLADKTQATLQEAIAGMMQGRYQDMTLTSVNKNDRSFVVMATNINFNK